MTKDDQKDQNDNDEFEKIRRYLPLRDYICLGSIYSSWSAVARKRHHCPRFGLPYLVIQDPNKKAPTRLYNLSLDRISLHEFHDFLYERFCCGSSQGWLVTIDFDLEMNLFDPFSRSQIKLPSLPSPSYEKEIICQIAKEMHKTEKQVWRDFTVYKVILSADPRTNSDYIVTIGFRWFEKLAFWKPGASTWTTICFYCGSIIDMLWHKEALYFITDRYFLLSFDMDRLIIPVHKFSLMDKELRYLVELGGELHIVLRDVEFPSIRTASFAVLKFNLENRELTELKSIGDNALFLGGNHSMAIPSNEFIRCQSDSIYFTDDDFKLLNLHGFEDLGNFNMKDGTLSRFLGSEDYTREKFPPIWLEAHPW